MKLTLGPVLYLWDASAWCDFYYRMADEADVDRVVIGEVVCSKRGHFHASLIQKVADRLASAGKDVAIASLALVTLERELNETRKLASGVFGLEASDISAHAAFSARSHSIGPLVNVYNAATAKFFAKGGAKSICLPPELPLASIAAIAAGAPAVPIEVFAFGKVPLAISARCPHARIKGHVKDNCQFVCGEDPDGLAVDTLSGQQFLSLNGVQTMSGTVQCTIDQLDDLRRAGVASLRLSPQVCDMVAVARTFRERSSGHIGADEAMRQLAQAYPGAVFADGFVRGLSGHIGRGRLDPFVTA